MTTPEELRKKLLVPDAELSKVAKEEKLKERTDFKESVQWRIFRIMAEFVDGFEFLSDFGKSVTFFGSTRTSSHSPNYKEIRKLASMLAKNDFAIFTGGGPGIMEAANRGANDVNGESVGLNIQLKYQQRINDYITKAMGFHYFFIRKMMLSYSAQAYVFAPGGLGTLDEFFEISTLIQTEKIPRHIPIVCLGKEYWHPLVDWIDKVIYEKNKFIDKDDRKIYQVVDSAEEAFEIIKNSKLREDVNY
ncbi:MAG: TIGR00730 family Rossman fold protein [Patescibacteria group bacterium]|nr:TIGR00730 family Rossman fold protein [Patescibacteria group bacterium]